MKRNGWEIAYIVWIVLVVGLMLFWPAKAAEDTERMENHTEEAEERTECVIEELEEALTAYNSGKPGKSAYASNVLAHMEAYYGD